MVVCSQVRLIRAAVNWELQEQKKQDNGGTSKNLNGKGD